MIDDTQVTEYRERGFLLVKGLLSKEEAKAMRAESHAVLERLGTIADPTWESARGMTDGVKTELRHCHDTQFQSAAFSKLLTDPRFTDTAAALLGTGNVQLHHTKLFVKPPEKGSPFPMHQDHPYFPHTHHRVAAAIFHFDDAPEQKGCVRAVPGSHLHGPLEHLDDGGYHLSPIDWPLDESQALPAEAGDVLFFTYLTVHGSGVNTSDEARTTWLVQFRDPADPPIGDSHSWSLGQGQILRGVDPTARSKSAR